MCKILLSPKQQQIVDFRDGALLVTASAGSGKTRVLTERICKLAQQTRRGILAITFTNKASEEIKERLQEQDYSLLEQVNVTTFHGFCMQVLESHAGAMNWSSMPQIFRDEDIRQVVVSAICESALLRERYLAKDNKGRNQLVTDSINAISRIKREMLLPEELDDAIVDKDVLEIYRLYCEYMDNLHAIDFDDLLLKTFQLFLANPKIASLYRAEYAYICVDEAQDMNKAQYLLLKALTGKEHHNVMLVGDVKQSIYAFNGSSSSFMMKNFVNDYAPVTTMQLLENYRSARMINDLAGRIMPEVPPEEYVKLEGVCSETVFDTPCDEAVHVVEKIKELTTSGKAKDIDGNIAYSDISILARNKFVLSKFEKELKEAGIPYYYKNTSGQINFTSTSAAIFNLALMVKLNEMDDLHFSKLRQVMQISDAECVIELRDTTPNPLYKLILDKVINLKQDGSNLYGSILSIIEYIKSNPTETELDEQELLVAYDEFLEIRQHWIAYSSSVNVTSLGAFRNAMALGQTIKAITPNAVALATVHTMKGQQSVIVFLVGMDDGTFPDYRAVKAGENSSDMQQEKNNLYVAVTRAQRHLYISYPKRRLMPWGDWSTRKRSSLLPKII